MCFIEMNGFTLYTEYTMLQIKLSIDSDDICQRAD
jgi:hypothetical protein